MMFSKGKSGYKLLESNPILSHYEVGRLYATGGPEGVWKIYEGISKADGKVGFIYTVFHLHLHISTQLLRITNFFLTPKLTHLEISESINFKQL